MPDSLIDLSSVSPITESGVITSQLAAPVRIDDHLVKSDLQSRLQQLVKRPIWQYGWKSNSQRDRFCYWHAHFAGGDDNCRVSCEDILFSNPLIPAIRDLWMLLKANHLEGHQPLRVYANSHTYGVEGYLHVDNPDPLNYFTTVYYAHPVWDKNWAGETIFYQPDTDEVIAAVYPRPGRVVTFHGNIPHVARAPSRDCPEVRVCIVFKTQRVT